MQASSLDDNDDLDQHQHQHPHVYLRLRPLSEIEVNRKSRHAVQVTQDQVTLDDGTFVTLDGVWQNVDESDSDNVKFLQEEEQDISRKLVQGHDCTVLAYGGTGTGKTSTLFGRPSSAAAASSSSMVQRVTEQVFQELQQQTDEKVKETIT